MARKTDLAIVNRSFWPGGQVIGEALLQFAEVASRDWDVCVITQAKENLGKTLKSKRRGEGLRARSCKLRTDSASSVAMRALDALFFTLWVFFCLVVERPKKVYVSTDPPVVVPFIVAIYCHVFRARFLYHLQDIHPEITNSIFGLSAPLFRILKALDNYTLKRANLIVTLSEDMRAYIGSRVSVRAPIVLLENPALAPPESGTAFESGDIVFCGNAGRVQRIPLLLKAISHYINEGGGMSFSFAGGGLYAKEIEALAQTTQQVKYYGVLPAQDAASLVAAHKWALLPIEDEVTKYAFPSKSSGYALSGVPILAVCGEDTSIAKWVKGNKLGKVCFPSTADLVNCFFGIEDSESPQVKVPGHLLGNLEIPSFSRRLFELSQNLEH